MTDDMLRIKKFPSDMSYSNVIERKKIREVEHRDDLKCLFRGWIIEELNSVTAKKYVTINCPPGLEVDDKKEILEELLDMGYRKMEVHLYTGKWITVTSRKDFDNFTNFDRLIIYLD